jgi:hypothetical protein
MKVIEMVKDLAKVAVHRIWLSWPVYVAVWYLLRTYNDIPGPHWVKVAVVTIVVFIPGGFDELLLVGLLALLRYARTRLTARKASVA